MAHQQPPKPSIHQFQIPRPTDPKALQEYLALGWYELGEELRWSHARGSPVHPGDAAHLDNAGWSTNWRMPPAPPLLSVLPLAVLSEGQSRLPPAAECDEDYLEVPVMVLIKYRRMTSKKGRSRHSFWTADEAKLIALAVEPSARAE